MLKFDRMLIEPGAGVLMASDDCYHVPGWERMLWPLGPSKATLPPGPDVWEVGHPLGQEDVIKDPQGRLRQPTE